MCIFDDWLVNFGRAYFLFGEFLLEMFLFDDLRCVTEFTLSLQISTQVVKLVKRSPQI